MSYTVNELEAKSSSPTVEDNFDVVFLIDCRNVVSSSEYAVIQKNIIETADTVFVKSPNARVKIVLMYSVGTYSDNGKSYRVMKMSDIKSVAPNNDTEYFSNIDDVFDALAKMSEIVSGGDTCNLTDAVNSVYDIAKYTGRKTYCFSIFKATGTLYQAANEDSYTVLRDIKENSLPINISANCLKVLKNFASSDYGLYCKTFTSDW